MIALKGRWLVEERINILLKEELPNPKTLARGRFTFFQRLLILDYAHSIGPLNQAGRRVLIRKSIIRPNVMITIEEGSGTASPVSVSSKVPTRSAISVPPPNSAGNSIRSASPGTNDPVKCGGDGGGGGGGGGGW